MKILNANVININRLKESLGEGIPDEAALIREYSWKLVLGYLPPEKYMWRETIEKQKGIY